MTEKPTPRTDKVAENIDWNAGDYGGYVEMMTHARQLERENQTFRAAQKACEYCDAPRVDRIDELERELTTARDHNEDMRDLLREIYNLTQLDRDCPVDLPHKALVHIGHIIDEKTPPTTP